MVRHQFLADTSAFARLSKPAVASAFARRAVEGRICLCTPVVFELGYSARTHGDYLALIERCSAFRSVPVTDADHRRAIEVQSQMSAKGWPLENLGVGGSEPPGASLKALGLTRKRP